MWNNSSRVRILFKPFINLLSNKSQSPNLTVLQQLKERYNGYRFSDEDDGQLVYNPYSLMKCFEKNKIDDYWFDTGTPTLLWKLFQREQYDLSTIKDPFMSQIDFS